MDRTAPAQTRTLGSRLSRRRALLAAAGSTMTAAWLAACRGSDGRGGGGNGRESRSVPTEAGTPKRGGTLTIPMRTEPVHLDLAIVSTYAANTVCGQAYNCLFKMSTGANVAPNAAVVEADLPGAWEQPDPLTYVYRLSGTPIKFHNLPPVNGRQLTADDITFTLERRLRPKIPQIVQPIQAASVDSVEAIDAKTVRIKLNQPDALLQTVLSDNSWGIIPREVVEADGDVRQRAIGSGPFILSDWNKGVSLTMKRNPDYWDAGKPYLDEIRLLVIGDYSTQVGQFIAGQLDMILQIEDPVQAADIKSKVKDAIVEQWTARAINWGFKINGRVDYLKDVRTRQAIGAAYNRELAVRTVYGGAAKTSTPYPPAWVEGQPDWQVPAKDLGPAYTYDPKAARQLLQAAGTLGVKVQVAVSGAGHGPQSLANGTFLAENLNAAGFSAQVYDAPYPEFASKFGYNADGNYDIMRAGHATTWDIGDAYLQQVNYAITGSGNNKRDFDPKLLDLSYKYRTLLQEEERKKQGFEIQKYHAEVAHYITAEANVYQDFWRPYVKNYRPSSLWSIGWGSRVFRELWLER